MHHTGLSAFLQYTPDTSHLGLLDKTRTCRYEPRSTSLLRTKDTRKTGNREARPGDSLYASS